MNAHSLIQPRLHALAWAAASLVVSLSAQAGSAPVNQRPAALRGPVQETVYDGNSDDLLTAGLGKTGLMGLTPAYVNPASPTAAELRRNAIYTNYRALVDYTGLGGMGVLYGPNIDSDGLSTLGEGKVPGREYLAWADDGSGKHNVTLMVQVPDSFDPARPCIITATSSGSRGVYGAIATAGEWGLKRGCAVAYTDKGTGNGLHDLMSGALIGRDGVMMNSATAGIEAGFRADLTPEALAAFNAATPNRVAYKHAHSQQNPEKDWGRSTLDAVRFAFYVLNERFGPLDPAVPGQHLVRFKARNTLVIASSVSNGGGAALAAAEQDTEGLIDGVAVSEPNAQPAGSKAFSIRQGSQTVAVQGKPLAAYFTLANVYQPCALLAPALSVNAAFWPASYTDAAVRRCQALTDNGLLTGATTAEQAADALARMRAEGWQAESDFLHQSLFRFATNAIAVTYVNALGRFSVADNLCGYSFANTDATGAPAAQSATVQAGLFASGNGVPPTSGVNIVYNPSVGGARLDFLATSPSSNQADFALDGALCLRSLVAGKDVVTGKALTGTLAAQSARVKAGMGEVKLEAKLRKLPVVIVAGRNDGLLPVNHTARPYFAKSQLADKQGPNVRYIEVTNAQHFDSFIAFGPYLGYDTRFVPLHPYFFRALDAVWAHLTTGQALPPSQVVRTTPRVSSSTQLSASHVPPILATPAAADLIVMDGSSLVVPE
ncbi:3-hydroxybutyrate oligomer hydrolase family protein [Ideonella sp.]|uniref:3-hydroxybutyrate oligomer hydrolase family protein n=1 Tax=Ideonella sp. TaxID=1929293 RepID=UPI003BB74ECD